MYEENHIQIKQKDGYITILSHLYSIKKPKASLLILHGMAEHHNRYQAFAEYLVNLGIDVFYYDHRGHGLDKKLHELGYIAPDKGYQLVIDDVISICEYIDHHNRSSKFFLMGHSMGSLIARNVIQKYDKFNGIILSGTTHPARLMTSAGILLSSAIKKFKGPKHISPYMNNLLFGSKKYTKLSTRTAFDWLSRSNPVVGAYLHDPYCGFICTVSFYNDLIKLSAHAGKKKLIRQTKRELPIYLTSGEQDPVGGYGKEVRKFHQILKKLGFSNITIKLYPECRHELLNELNNKEVYSDLHQWISKRI